jgi:hypothetical protein
MASTPASVPASAREGDRLAARADDLLHRRFRFHLIEIGHSHLGTSGREPRISISTPT